MASDQSKPSPYPASRKRRRTRDFPPAFNEFIDLFYSGKDHVDQMINEWEKIQASLDDSGKKFERGAMAGVATAMTSTAVLVVAVPFASVLLVGLGVGGLVAAAATTAGFGLTAGKEQNEAKEKLKSLTDELRSKCELVSEKLNEMEWSCAELRMGNRYSDETNHKLKELEENIQRVRGEILKATGKSDFEEILSKLDDLCEQINLTFKDALAL